MGLGRDDFKTRGGGDGRGGGQGAGLARAALRLDDVNQLVEDHRDQNDRADDDEGPVVIQAPDSSDAPRVGSLRVEPERSLLPHVRGRRSG